MSLLEPTSVTDSTPTPTTGGTATVPLSSIKAVSAYLPYIDSARERVTSDMEQMVITGLKTLVRFFSNFSPDRLDDIADAIASLKLWACICG